MNKKKIITYVIIIIYAFLLLLLLLNFNSKRAGEYTYGYDLSLFNLDAGTVTEDGALLIDASSEFKGTFASSRLGQYRSADYSMTIRYACDTDQRVHLYANSNFDSFEVLPASGNEVTCQFSVWPSSDMFSIKFEYGGEGNFRIDSVTVTANKPLYTDYEYYMILTVLLGLLIPAAVLYLTKKKDYGKEEWTIAGILALLGIIVDYPLVKYPYLWLGTDMRPHLMRIEGVSKSIEARFIPTLIYSNYCNDYGELSCMYPDKFLYFSGLLRNRGVSLLSSYMTSHVLINIATIVIMYFCAKYLTGSKKSAVTAAVLYCFIPYRLYVMYGGAQTLGNGLAMMFFPIVFTALYDILFLKGKKWYLLTIGVTGILCSHILSTILCVITCVLTVIVCEISLMVRKEAAGKQKQIWLDIVKAVAAFLVLSLSTIVPFMYYYLQGLSTDNMLLRFMDSLGYFSKNFLSENGIFHILLIVCIVVLLSICRKRKYDFSKEGNHYGVFCGFLLAFGILMFWCSTNAFPWGIFVKIPFIEKSLNMFQFAERFMLAGCGSICLGIGMLVKPFVENTDKKKYVMMAFSVALVIFTVIGCVKIENDLSGSEILVSDRMVGNIYYRQLGYLPKGTDITYYESATPNCGDWDHVENLSYIKNGTSIHYEYTCSIADNYIEFPLFNYLGYEAYDAYGNRLEIINSDHNRIRVGLKKSDEPQVVDIAFKEKGIFKLCAVISFVGTVVLYFYIFRRHKKDEKDKQTGRK